MFTLRALHTQRWRRCLVSVAACLVPVAAINCGSDVQDNDSLPEAAGGSSNGNLGGGGFGAQPNQGGSPPAITCDRGTLTVDENGSNTIEIDSLTKLASLSGYTSIVGNVVVHSALLNDLSQLECLESVVGNFDIGTCKLEIPSEIVCAGNPELSNLAGLERLNSISGNLRIEGNPKLVNLNGLTSLTHIGGNFTVHANGVVDLAGIEQLETIDGDLAVGRCDQFVFPADPLCYYNEELTALTGLESLQSVKKLSIIGPKLQSLSALQSLTKVDDLSIQKTGLTNLSGLEGLAEISGDLILGGCQEAANKNFHFYGNTELTDLTGLNSLTAVPGDVAVECNPKLTSLYGLNEVTTIGGNLSIIGNAIIDMSGLDKLSSISGYFLTYKWGTTVMMTAPGYVENAQLTSLNGLQSLKSVSGLRIAGTNLATLTGLNNLQTVSYYFAIGNTALTDLSGLDSLSTVNGSFSISSCWAGDGGFVNCLPSNPLLTSVDGLTSLSSVGSLYFRSNTALTDLHGLVAVQVANDVEIIDNTALPTCEAQWLVDWLTQKGWQGNSVVQGNLDGGSCP